MKIELLKHENIKLEKLDLVSTVEPEFLLINRFRYAYVCKAWEKFAFCVRNFGPKNHKRSTMMMLGGEKEILSPVHSPNLKNHRKLHLGRNS